MNIQRKSPSLARKAADQAHVDSLTAALRDAAGWLKSAGNICGMPCLKDAAARAYATLAEVNHG